jgi:hypothetical protein
MSRHAKRTPLLPEEVEGHRDRMWRRDPEWRVESAADAERFVEEVGFASALTDTRKPGPSLFMAVCGRRDARLPRNVQKDPEASHAWVLKDEVLKRGKVYYAKLLRGRATFVAPRLVPAFNALWGVPRPRESDALSPDARAVLRALRKEWEMATSDLREASGVGDRARFGKALDELQGVMKVVPGDVVYVPKFTYIWWLAEGRFAPDLKVRVTRERALTEVARAYLAAAGQTERGELARVTGLSRVEAGKGNHALVAEGFAERVAEGVYRLSSLGGGF